VAKASLPVYSSQRRKKASGLTTTWTHSLTASLARSGRNQVTLVPRNTATLTDRGRPMNSHLAAHSNYPADRRARYDETTLRNGSAGLAVRRLTRRASVMLTLVLSLALWAAIWAAVGWLASVLLG
jgi:hypothetical protein